MVFFFPMTYDLVVLGAGAAGMTASIYASRYKIDHLVFGDKIGGQFVDAHVIENYPGFTSVDGLTLMTKFRQHVEAYGIKIREEKIGGLSLSDLQGGEHLFEILTETGGRITARSIILAMGARHRALNVPGEENYLGRGVSYCSTCDAPLFRGKTVAVVGGGNSAITAALHLSEFASKVYLVHRRETFDRVDPVWLDSLSQKKNIVKVLNTQVKEIFGDAGPSTLEVASLKLDRNNSIVQKTEEVKANLSRTDVVRGLFLTTPFEGTPYLSVDGVFIEIGLIPAISLANQIGIEADPAGYILARGDLQTNVTGAFAAGDLVKQSDVPQLRQIVTSAGQGAIAAASVYAYLHKKAPAPDWG